MKNKHLFVPAIALLFGLLATACRSTAPEPTSPAAASPPTTAVADVEVWSNTITWATSSEVDNFGYDIYRSESPDGPFERLTEEPIEGAGTTDEISRYELVDDSIDPRKTYYYYIESISMDGVRERFTPVGKKDPKIPPVAETPG